MLRFRFAARLPEGDPSYNLSVTFGDTSPCRRGLGIPQTSASHQSRLYLTLQIPADLLLDLLHFLMEHAG